MAQLGVASGLELLGQGQHPGDLLVTHRGETGAAPQEPKAPADRRLSRKD